MMQLRFAVGFAVMASVAIACSSNNDPLAGQGGGGDGGCPRLDTSASGGAIYVKNRVCMSCHGNDMSGSPAPLTASQSGLTIPAGVYLYPPNLTPDMTTGIGKWTDAQLKLAIVHGIDNMSEDLCPEMKHYLTMCDDEVAGIIAYLHSIPAVSKVIPGSVCPPLKFGPGPDGG